jgi:PPP family 3-phenylpropionic acid transporter
VLLSLFWFLYLGSLGLLLPFFSLYLSDNARLSATEVGIVVTMSPLAALVAPPAWGWFADRSRSRVRVLASVTLAVAVATAGFPWLEGFWQLAAGAFVVALFATGVIPLVVAVTLAALGDEAPYRFGQIRVWGTIGFLVFVVSFPQILRALPPAVAISPEREAASEPGLWVMFPVAAALVLVSALVAFVMRDSHDASSAPRSRRRMELARHTPLVRLLVVTFATYLFLQGPMNLFPLYLRSRGGGLETLSRMWIFMLLLEIPLIAFSGAGLRQLGPRGLLGIGIAAGGIRWLVCGTVHDVRAIFAAQLLHGVTVAGVGIGSAVYVDASVPGRLRSTGQGLNATSLSIGSIVSNVAAGSLMDRAGVNAPYLVGGAATIVLALLVPLVLPPPRRFEDAAL